eukprot:CAMPEP_0181230224 /NCGR_PEP_ID=MMETSP1096-20121128/34347_1 /TAXON_ID=156174 ORGANISM="Chrysochromulina ericina, Strain CCMP281" /NCGR_SAMPLE_ID=MMETSP1096 /ASSEMBLY_ACC=CAM_ASM_000453 /LENGTH=71 /DNA_ID=CAMNT_0023323961 /DNA_START=365 /DNA_END=580 /DNA_ORIENTATION=+
MSRALCRGDDVGSLTGPAGSVSGVRPLECDEAPQCCGTSLGGCGSSFEVSAGAMGDGRGSGLGRGGCGVCF